MTERAGTPAEVLERLRSSGDARRTRELLTGVARDIPKGPDSLGLFERCFELAKGIEDPAERETALLEVVKEMPSGGVFAGLYARAAEAAIFTADVIPEHNRRTTELLRIEGEIPRTGEFLALRRLAWRLVLGLPDRPRHHATPLEEVARELPKASDLAFYRRYTLLGIASLVPRDRDFMDIYCEAMNRAMDAVSLIPEPYYRKYALLHIKAELPDLPWVKDLYSRALVGAVNASFEIKDPFAKQHALIDMLREVPKTQDHFPLLQDLIGRSLAFFTVRRWMEDVEVTDVVDFILSAEERGLKESKKKRYSRGKYAKYLSRELEEVGARLKDVRFLEVLRPYTHVWVQPRMLRDSVKKVVDHLEALGKTYHGREIKRPVFVAESHRGAEAAAEAARRPAASLDCISIDLGATNTVVMRKRGGSPPDFVDLGVISTSYDNARVVPTVISRETNAIGAEVMGMEPVGNIKQMLLEGNPRGRQHMERFFRALCQQLRKTVHNAGWFSILSKSLADNVYITVPLGFAGYRDAVREMAKRHLKGTRTELIEEPLAAAVGYEVAERRDKLTLVIDFGGATLDVLLVRLNIDEVHVVARPERAHILGGSDIDMWLAESLAEKAGLGGSEVPPSLVARAEEIKIALSASPAVPFVWEGREVAVVTRDDFERLLDRRGFYAAIDRAISYVLVKAEKVGLGKKNIEAVLLTGGSSQIPSFKDKVGYIFPELREGNFIYDHSPLSAVGRGAALYGTKDVYDRHLGMAYALKYTLEGKESTHTYTIVLEKGETLPFSRTFRLEPAEKLGPQSEIYIELFAVPESQIVRRWVREDGLEFIKQEIQQSVGRAFEPLKTVTLTFDEPLSGPVEVRFDVDESGNLSVVYGPGRRSLAAGVRLQ